MSAATTPPLSISVLECLEEISRLLSEALHKTNAAIVCAKAGADHEAVQIVMDMDQNTFEANQLLTAVTFVKRLRGRLAG